MSGTRSTYCEYRTKTPMTPIQAYHEKITSGALTKDAAQSKVMRELQAIYKKL